MAVAVASFGSGPAFAADGLHEVYAAGQAEAVCLSGCLLAMGGAGGAGAVLWIRQVEQNREAGMPSAAGLRELGIDPGRVVLVLPRDPLSALQAALEGARCAALGGVVLELWGEVRPYDLTAKPGRTPMRGPRGRQSNLTSLRHDKTRVRQDRSVEAIAAATLRLNGRDWIYCQLTIVVHK